MMCFRVARVMKGVAIFEPARLGFGGCDVVKDIA